MKEKIKLGLMGLLFAFMSGASGQRYLDSLKLTAEEKRNPVLVMNAFSNYSRQFYGVNPEVQNAVAAEMLAYANNIKKDSLIAIGYNALGTSLQFMNRFDSAISFHKQGLILASKSGYLKEVSESYKLLGNAYYRLNKKDSTIIYYSKAADVAKELNNKRLTASLLHNTGVVYKSSMQFAKAIESFREAMAINMELGDSGTIVNSCMSIGNAMWEKDLGNYDSVKYYFYKALSYLNEEKNPNYAFQLFDNISLLHTKTMEPKLALKFSKKCDPYIPYIQDYRILARYYHQRSWAMAMLKIAGAKPLMDKGFYYANKSGDMQAIGDAAEGLFKYHYGNTNMDSGDYYYEIFIRSRDSIYSQNALQAVAEAEEKFENEKISLQNRTLNSELKTSELKRNRMWLLVAAAGLLLIVGFLIYRARINKMKLEQNKREIAFQEELVASNLKSQEEERTKIARELHDGLNQQITGVILGLDNLTENVNEGLEKQTSKIDSLKKIITNVSREVRGISHQLIPQALLNGTLSDAISDMVDFYNSNQQQVAFTFDEMVEDLHMSKIHQTYLYRITQELISNILKHSKAETAEIQMYKRSNKLLLLVSDNGVGFNKTDGKFSGIGLENIKSRVALLNGIVSFENEMQGTLVRISVPLEG